MSDFNSQIIDEFRSAEGKVGGMFEGAPLLLLHHKGAKSGTSRISPLMYQAVGDAYAIFASKGGADTNPAWFHNLTANPETQIEVGSDSISVRARVAEGPEYEDIWNRQKAQWPQFAEYEAKTARSMIPVVVLEPR